VEGVKIKWCSTVDHFGADGIDIEEMAVDADGKLAPTGKTHKLAADSVVMAVGQHSDLSLVDGVENVRLSEHNTLIVDQHMMTGQSGIFAGGDAIGGGTMTAAVGHGKKAARNIDAWLRGEAYRKPVSNQLVSFDMLHIPGHMAAPRSGENEVPVEQRAGFQEIIAGLDEKSARYEAQRCLSCGNCFECDMCYAACPEQAINRQGKGLGYVVDLELCSGCAACFEQCPCHAIEMAPEPPESSRQPLPAGSLGEPISPSRFKTRS